MNPSEFTSNEVIDIEKSTFPYNKMNLPCWYIYAKAQAEQDIGILTSKTRTITNEKLTLVVKHPEYDDYVKTSCSYDGDIDHAKASLNRKMRKKLNGDKSDKLSFKITGLDIKDAERDWY